MGMHMEIDEAIMAFSQSEKIKAGIIWTNQLLEIVQGQPESERVGGVTLVNALLNMVAREIALARNLVPQGQWAEGEAPLERALTMINSGVPQEAPVHLGQALSKITNIGQRSMSLLKQEKLL
jgi:hypothetical protein